MKWRCERCGQENLGLGKCSRCGFRPSGEGYFISEIKPSPGTPVEPSSVDRNPFLEDKAEQPMYILWLIREGFVQNKKKLISHFIGHLHPLMSTSVPYFVDETLKKLVSAGLIEISSESEEIKVTDLYWRVKSVLGYSLKEFAKNDPKESMIVSPIFGLARKPALSYDLFVLMPFRAELEPVYEDHMKAIAKELNMTIARADDLFTTGSVIEEIWSCIAQSRIILADCTGRNPNVFYEIGIAHTLGKAVVLITQNEDDVPFDVGNRRFIKYEYTPRGMEEFEHRLKATLISLKTEFISSLY
jgi:hypothetical protein